MPKYVVQKESLYHVFSTVVMAATTAQLSRDAMVAYLKSEGWDEPEPVVRGALLWGGAAWVGATGGAYQEPTIANGGEAACHLCQKVCHCTRCRLHLGAEDLLEAAQLLVGAFEGFGVDRIPVAPSSPRLWRAIDKDETLGGGPGIWESEPFDRWVATFKRRRERDYVLELAKLPPGFLHALRNAKDRAAEAVTKAVQG